MPRRLRLHVDHGFFYVIQCGSESRRLFTEAGDYAQFEDLLVRNLTRCSARVHAFCWLPCEAHLLVQVAKEPIGRLMQQLTSRYTRAMNQKSGREGSMFRHHYTALLIDPDRYLLDVVRHIHQAPLRAHIVSDLDAFRTSSHPPYAGMVTIPWLTTQVVREQLDQWGHTAADAYLEYMRTRRGDAGDLLAQRDSRQDPRVLGDSKFIAQIPRSANAYRSTVSLEQIVESVALTLGVRQDEIHSRSSGRDVTLARAAIAWHAVERGVATLAEVARRLDRGPSSLSEAITRYRRRRPELFQRGGLREAAPLLAGLLLDQQHPDADESDEE